MSEEHSGAGAWDFWIDRGGTFTDVVARGPDGVVRTLKLLSEDPRRYADASVEGVRRLLATAPAEARGVGSVRIGTTVATNALLERRGAPVVLVITEGFADAIRIGGQQRPDIFALAIELPQMLYTRVIEARERVGADGAIVTPLDAARLARDLASARAAGIDSVAIVLVHGYRYPEHERAAAALAAAAGFTQICVSHRVSPLPKLVTRGDTTLVDAYLSPLLGRYVASVRAGLERHLGDAPLLCMQSHGGLIEAGGFSGKDSLLSGPAGGVIGMVGVARAAGYTRAIGFDMGGTSTDVSLYDGELERTGEAVVADVRVSAPMLAIHTVAAGGGSILTFASGRPQVGPESAGAQPGPSCYGNGGPLTVTDANVLLGRIQADFFPRVFGPGADQPIDTEAVARAFAALAADVSAASGQALSAEELAAGYLRIAVERMANAIKQISIARGHDPAHFVLCAFGGAAGQHACAVADALGIDTVLIHPLAGVLSAYGMGVADVRVLRQASVTAPLDSATLAALRERAAALALEARAAVAARLAHGRDVGYVQRLHVKTAGSDTTLAVAWPSGATAGELAAAFAAAHERHFGFGVHASAPLVIDSIEIEAVAAAAEPLAASTAPNEPSTPAGPPCAFRSLYYAGQRRDVPVYDRQTLPPRTHLDGPALVVEAHATTVLEPGWRARVDDAACLVLERAVARGAHETVGAAADPIMLEIFNNAFMHVAEEMGVVLASTAHSVNIKERLDFSCALFDAAGELIANAPHIPVHLGSMGASVQSVLRDRRDLLAPGTAFMLNTPYNGGTHLPDVTVVTPVFGEGSGALEFVVASRAHHADVGGTSPGSMPPHSRSIDEEGVLLDGEAIVRDGVFLEARVRELFAAGRYPARNIDRNVADLLAQLAANARGVAQLRRLGDRFGAPVVRAYMRHVQDNAEECVRAALTRLQDGSFRVALDGGEEIAVAIRIDSRSRSATIDFTGTSAQSASNFNAPSAIVHAAVLYVFRTLVRERIPLNAGCLRPLHVELPSPSLLAPRHPAAVVAGNVETSQCVTDALLAALGVCAAAQGTMNNFTFGDAVHQYYETICGGAGAGPGFAGATAVQTHMTNSRLTDVEVLEQRFPVRVRRFAIRSGSGGDGCWRGGDGVVRDIEFLVPMRAAILANRRRTVPFGLAGGGPGAAGRNYVVRASGTVEPLPATAETALAAGDRFVIETPGGGGYGPAAESSSSR